MIAPPSRWTRPAALALAASLAALAAGGGCDASFPSYDRLAALRVLAIRSDPVSTASGETATLSALVYTAPGQPVTSYAWSWCPLVGPSTSGYPCLLTEADVSALAGQPVSFDLGHAATASLANDLAPSVLRTICAGRPELAPPPDCADGLPITVQLAVATAADQIVAVGPFKLLFSADQEANDNPTLSEPFAVIGGANQDLDAAGTPVLPRDVETPIGVMVPDDASETYLGADDNGNPAQVREQLVLTWFVESGNPQHQNTVFIDGVVSLADAARNQWTPGNQKDYPSYTARLIVVVRDGRNGVAWTSGLATLGSSP